MNTTPETKPVAINIDAGRVGPKDSGARALLLLDPEARDVTTWWAIGSGVPQHVYSRRWIAISIDTAADGVSLREAVEAKADAVDELFSLYRGTRWDGQNQVGAWGCEGQCTSEYEACSTCERVAELRDLIEEAAGAVACYADASEYLGQAWSEVKRDVRAALLSGRDLDGLAASYASECADQGTLLDKSDVRASFDHAAEELRGHADDEDLHVVRLGKEPTATALCELTDGELPDADGFGERWCVVEANNAFDAILRARALDGAGREAALAAALGQWDDEYVAPLVAHLGRKMPA